MLANSAGRCGRERAVFVPKFTRAKPQSSLGKTAQLPTATRVVSIVTASFVLMEERYALLTEWWDATAQLTRQFQLLYYVGDNTLEMVYFHFSRRMLIWSQYDIRNRRTFLKRCPYPSVQPKDLFIGSVITVFARQLTIIDYGDDYTRSKLGSKLQRHVTLDIDECISL